MGGSLQSRCSLLLGERIGYRRKWMEKEGDLGEEKENFIYRNAVAGAVAWRFA